jgi:H+/Cl- antiporter ClcA
MSRTQVTPVPSGDGDNTRLFSADAKEAEARGPGSPFTDREVQSGAKNIEILEGKKFMAPKSYGSRMVGGKKPTNLEQYRKFESVSYIVPDTAAQEAQFMRMTPAMSGRRRCLLWVRYTITGIVVSLTIAGALRICGIIEYERVKATTKHLDGYYTEGVPDVVSAWGFWVGTSLAMNFFAVCMVLIQPAAASSGIPGLISFLNGVEPPGGKSPITGKLTSFVSVQTMTAKFLGMLASIPSGLCIGPEGPIIHISALLSYWVTRTVHKIEEQLMGKEFDNDTEHERRDFLATGAACGICTAFRAPLAGTLFVVEEAGSFFTTQHLEFTFFACLVSYWVQWVLGYASGAYGATGPKFIQQTGFFCNTDSPLNMVAYLIMAVCGGVLGALFNQIVEHLNHHRAHHINKHGWKRVVEVMFLTALTGTIVVFLPMGASCRTLTRDVMLEDNAGCFPAKDFHQVSFGTVSWDYMNRLSNISLPVNASSAAVNASAAGVGGGRRALINARRQLAVSDDSSDYYGKDEGKKLSGEELLDSVRKELIYRAPEYNYDKSKKIRSYKEYDVLMLDNFAEHGPYIHVHYEHTYTCEGKHDYNDMAMLWLNGGVYGVKALMQRGFPHQLSEQTLAVFLVVYFTLAAITSGTHVPAGLVVPMLLIGGSFGRLFGLLWLKIKVAMCSNYEGIDTLKFTNSEFDDAGYDVYQWASSYRWMVRDCKLPDPGTFAVIGMSAFMGGSGRISVMLAIVMLELTGDAGLIAPVGLVCVLSMLVGNMFNHGLYHGLIPIMNIPYLNALPAQVMYVSRVTEIMGCNVVCLPQHCSINELRVLQVRIQKGRTTHNAFPVVQDDFNKTLVGLLRRTEMNKLFAHINSNDQTVVGRIFHPVDGTIDLTQYCDRSPLTVTSNSTVSRAYEVFRKLGLRHLVVLGRDGTVVGMVTRKDLMIFKLVDQKHRELESVKKLQGRVRIMLKNNGYYDRNPQVSRRGSGSGRNALMRKFTR